MQYVLLGGGALLALLVILQWLRKTNVRGFARLLRWTVGGLLAALSLFLVMRGQVGLVTLTGPAAYLILKHGRIGNFSFESNEISDDNESQVKSRHIIMRLDHETGDVHGRVVHGKFRGRDLMSLDEFETRALLDEVGTDSDSLALLETWLDKNRAGWREYFAGESQAEDASGNSPPLDPVAEAYDVLGLEPGASDDEIRAAHKKLMMGVHPDQGGSNYLASKINGAKDRLLKTKR